MDAAATGSYQALGEVREQREAVVCFVKDKARHDPHIIPAFQRKSGGA
jgi:hypothetical protein